MIFRQWEQVLNGTKTETRRALHADDRAIVDINENGDDVIGEIRRNGRIRFRVGQLLPIIPKRGAKACRDESGNIVRVRVLYLGTEPVQAIDETAAVREGVADVAAYRALWESINRTKPYRWTDNPLVAVVRFEVVQP